MENRSRNRQTDNGRDKVPPSLVSPSQYGPALNKNLRSGAFGGNPRTTLILALAAATLAISPEENRPAPIYHCPGILPALIAASTAASCALSRLGVLDSGILAPDDSLLVISLMLRLPMPGS